MHNVSAHYHDTTHIYQPSAFVQQMRYGPIRIRKL